MTQQPNRCPGFARCADPKPNAYSHACALPAGHSGVCKCTCEPTFEHLEIRRYDPACGTTHSPVEGCPDLGEVYSDTTHRDECTNPACGHCH